MQSKPYTYSQKLRQMLVPYLFLKPPKIAKIVKSFLNC